MDFGRSKIAFILFLILFATVNAYGTDQTEKKGKHQILCEFYSNMRFILTVLMAITSLVFLASIFPVICVIILWIRDGFKRIFLAPLVVSLICPFIIGLSIIGVWLLTLISESRSC